MRTRGQTQCQSIGRVYMLSRKSGLPFAEILPTIFIERAVDIAFTVGIFLASLPFITGTSGASRIGGVIGVLVGIGLLSMYLLARNNQWALNTFHQLSARWPTVQRLGGSILEPFLAGLIVLTDGWVFARFLFYMTLNWLLAIVNYYVIILAFFPQTQITWAMFGLGAAALGGADIDMNAIPMFATETMHREIALAVMDSGGTVPISALERGDMLEHYATAPFGVRASGSETDPSCSTSAAESSELR